MAKQKPHRLTMGIRNYLIDGVSCTGKSTVCDALQQRGYQAIHGDRELAYWGDPRTGTPVDTRRFENWIWDVDKVKALVADNSQAVTFFCGGSRNVEQFIDTLDGVFTLQIDLATLNTRLANRSADEWSGSPSVGEAAARQQHASNEGIPTNAILIDATAPIDRVVDSILRCTAS